MNQHTKKRRIWLIRLLIFISACIVIEFILRLAGQKPGESKIHFPDPPVYRPIHTSDAEGIIRFNPDAIQFLPEGYEINHQGFRSIFDFTKRYIDSVRNATGKKAVMLIGDSFTEGCCAKPVSMSFPDLLQKDDRYLVLNFGIGATDPLQYELIVNTFVPELRPDVVVVVVFLGNDLVKFERIPTPGIPLFYQYEDLGMVPAHAPLGLGNPPNTIFDKPEDAFNYLKSVHTLSGPNPSLMDRICAKFVIGTKVWGMLKAEYYKTKGILKRPKEPKAYLHFQKIKQTCDENGIPVLFSSIPTARDVDKGIDIEEKYKADMKGTEYAYPKDLEVSDYEYPGASAHFGNGGHGKFTDFLAAEISNVLEKRKNE